MEAILPPRWGRMVTVQFPARRRIFSPIAPVLFASAICFFLLNPIRPAQGHELHSRRVQASLQDCANCTRAGAARVPANCEEFACAGSLSRPALTAQTHLLPFRLQIITFPWRTIILDVENVQPE